MSTIYVVVPHTYQTIPFLHAVLAEQLHDSASAIELLKDVQLLQYFDFTGLTESVAEVSERIFQTNQSKEKAGSNGKVRNIMLVQGLSSAISTVHRRSGLVQANALLASLLRNITQLSRMAPDVLIMIEAAVDTTFQSLGERRQDVPKSKRYLAGIELETAFTSPIGECLRLVCGNETLSRTLDMAFDTMIVVHDGFGRGGDESGGPKRSQRNIVEVTKDRVGNMAGFWRVSSGAAVDVDLDLDHFRVSTRSGVAAMHAALLPPSGKVVFLDKVENYSELHLPNQRSAYSSVYDPETGQLSPLSVSTNAFCCGGTFLADGRLITVGGNGPLPDLDPTVGDGFDAIRYLRAGQGDNLWSEPGNKLSSKRWYASAQTLADGKVFVAAGSLNALDVLNHSNNNPTYEILDAEGISNGRNIRMDILVDHMPY
ncbi:hypothetical protein HRR78_005695 [Exophiala dermatitidis]|nr:hypothetical protein HRR78_005695 [Exophiala dermatitidis]